MVGQFPSGLGLGEAPSPNREARGCLFKFLGDAFLLIQRKQEVKALLFLPPSVLLTTLSQTMEYLPS